jgi:hypothetical protein
VSGFQDENHFASWLGLTPAKDISGGKIVRWGKRKVKSRVAVALRTAATTLLKSDSYLGARYRSLRRKLPSFAAAVKAMGRYLAVLIYRLLTKRRSLGRPGHGAIRTAAHRTGTGEPELQSRRPRFQTDSDHPSQLNHPGAATDFRRRKVLGCGVLNPGERRSLHPVQFPEKQNPRGGFLCQRAEVSGERRVS